MCITYLLIATMFELESYKGNTLSDKLFDKHNLKEIHFHIYCKWFMKWISASITYNKWDFEGRKNIKWNTLREVLDEVELFINNPNNEI